MEGWYLKVTITIDLRLLLLTMMVMGEIGISEINGVHHDTIGQLTEIGDFCYDFRSDSTYKKGRVGVSIRVRYLSVVA